MHASSRSHIDSACKETSAGAERRRTLRTSLLEIGCMQSRQEIGCIQSRQNKHRRRRPDGLYVTRRRERVKTLTNQFVGGSPTLRRIPIIFSLILFLLHNVAMDALRLLTGLLVLYPPRPGLPGSSSTEKKKL